MQTYGQRWRRQDGRQEQARGQNSKLSSQGREQARMDSTGRHGSRERAAGSSRPDERAGQQGSAAGEQARRGRRQEQRAARLPSFLCTNTFVAVLVLVPIMYRYRNKDELGNPCVLMHTTQ